MSLDRTLKSKSALVRSRSVLTRAERLQVLIDNERWDDSQSVFGLPKITVQRRKSKPKAKAEAASAGAGEQAAAESGSEPAAEKKS